MEQEIKEEIWELYFEKMYGYSELERHFEGKYSYSQIRSVIDEKYKELR